MKNSTTKIKKYRSYLFSVLFIILIWEIISVSVNASLIFPGPKEVFIKILDLLGSLLFWKNFFHTFLRIIISYLITVISGILLGYLCGTYEFFKDFLEIPVAIIRSTPVISVILLTLFWFPSNLVPVFVCILMTLPIMITNVTQGFIATNNSHPLMEMGRVFKLSWINKLIYIRIPEAKNNIVSGLIAVFGLSWKVVIAGEVLCLPKNAIGSLLQKSQVHLESAQILAETIIMIFICFIVEKVLRVFLLQKEEK